MRALFYFFITTLHNKISKIKGLSKRLLPYDDSKYSLSKRYTIFITIKGIQLKINSNNFLHIWDILIITTTLIFETSAQTINPYEALPYLFLRWKLCIFQRPSPPPKKLIFWLFCYHKKNHRNRIFTHFHFFHDSKIITNNIFHYLLLVLPQKMAKIKIPIFGIFFRTLSPEKHPSLPYPLP